MSEIFGKVAVLMGGLSAEREISHKSGTMMLATLKSSLVPMAARARGTSFEYLVLRILESAHVG